MISVILVDSPWTPSFCFSLHFCLSESSLNSKSMYSQKHFILGYIVFSLSVTCGRSEVFSKYSSFHHHNITEILLKVMLNTITLTHSVHQVFSSPGPKVQVNYCHHLASVVCKLFTFQASSPKPLGQLEPNLAGMFLGWSSTSSETNWNPNCKGMIIGMSFTNFLFFMLIGNPRWPPPQDID